jgi:hypothetical protein
MFSKEPGGPGAAEFDHPSRTYRGATGDQPCTAQGSSVIRMRQGTVPRRASPPRDGVLALAFHTLLSFQGTSPGCSSATHLRFPWRSPPERRGRYHGPFKIVKDFPPARPAYSWWSTTRHVDTFTQKRRPVARTLWASGRPPNSRRIESSWRSATPCLPVPAPLASAGEVLGLEELPCLQL